MMFILDSWLLYVTKDGPFSRASVPTILNVAIFYDKSVTRSKTKYFLSNYTKYFLVLTEMLKILPGHKIELAFFVAWS